MRIGENLSRKMQDHLEVCEVNRCRHPNGCRK